MSTFLYKALTQDGQEVTGTLEYPEEQAVITYLHAQGYIPLDIEEKKSQNETKAPPLARKLRKFSVVDFTNGMGMLLRAGMPIDKSLASLIAATSDKHSRQFLQKIERDIREGSSLSMALRPFEQLFGNLYISMVLAGEVAGNLDASMDRLSSYLVTQKELKDKIVSAMIYPIILLVVTVISIMILMVVVMPRFKQLFDDMGAEVPAVTRMFLSASDFLQQYGMLMALIFASFFPIIMFLKRHRELSVVLDRFVLKLPWIGSLIRKVQLSSYAETLSMMMNCGIPIQRTLEISQTVISNSWIRQELSQSSEQLKEGATFSATIGRHFPLLTQQMVRIGEQAGELDTTLEKISSISQQEVNRDIHRVIGIMEPLIIVTLGLIVAAVIGSIMVAVLSMNDLISI